MQFHFDTSQGRLLNVCQMSSVLWIYFQEAYSVARQFNQIPPICEQAEYHMFQREKVEVQLPDLFQKIGNFTQTSHSQRLTVECIIIATTACVWTRGLSLGIGAMTWSPLACGILSGKYTKGIPPCSRASLKVTAHRTSRGILSVSISASNNTWWVRDHFL